MHLLSPYYKYVTYVINILFCYRNIVNFGQDNKLVFSKEMSITNLRRIETLLGMPTNNIAIIVLK